VLDKTHRIKDKAIVALLEDHRMSMIEIQAHHRIVIELVLRIADRDVEVGRRL